MQRSVLSRMRMIALPVILVCLTGVLITTWQVKSQIQVNPPQEPRGRGMSAMIDGLKTDGLQFPAYELSSLETPLNAVVPQDQVIKGTAFNINDLTASTLSSGINQTLTLVLPDPFGSGTGVELELTQIDILAEGFRVRTSSTGGQLANVTLGTHYRGAVKGIPGSVASISVFDNEIAGLYSTPEQGNFVIGKMGGAANRTNLHVVYPSSELKNPEPYTCETKDDGVSIPMQNTSDNVTQLPGGCVKIYVETDFDLFQNKGSVQAVINYVQGIFAQSSTIYANDGVPISLSEVFVWDTTSPYTASSSSALLSQFQSFRNSFNGDLGHLLALRGGGGIAAGFNGFCNSNWDQKQCFSGINATYSNYPTYSWTVMVFTHEMGHLMGSRHTHACVWNGNNTAIDGCSAVEGTCARPGIPAAGGTIMSYCHLQSVGTNLANGFGPQPSALIRSRVTNATCITPCDGGCTYSISPTSASYAAAGGSGTVAVTAGGGCAWTAASNASWITITSGSSGSGNGSVAYTVAANAGTSSRSGTLTVAGSTFTVTQAGTSGGTQLITNGGFEGSATPWVLSGNAIRSTGAYPHSGTGYSIVAYSNNGNGTEYQQIAIPAGGSPNLTFWLNLTSSETTTTTAYDNMYVEVRNTSGTLLATLATFSNLNKQAVGVYTQRGPYNLSAWAGQTVRIQFRAVNDVSLTSSFRVDDVSVQ